MRAEVDGTQFADRLWSAYRSDPSDELREQIIAHYRPLAQIAIRRLCLPWDEDLEQVALIGLVKAVDRFDPTRDNGFFAFAFPTVLGEIKRYLRDHTHMIRCPRSLHELRDQVRSRQKELTRETGRAPTLAELAEMLRVDLDQVVEAMAMEETCRPCSLDKVVGLNPEHRPLTLGECLGKEDESLHQVEARVAWDQILDHLAPQMRRIIELRYFHQLSQSEAGQRLGISQMHVSRLYLR
jgi:RNA polymerase sigma-B factor